MANYSKSVTVGVSDCRVSDDVESSLVTYALGSCIAVAVHDPVSKVGGMLHFMLPESSLDPVKAQGNPCLFADTGVAVLLNQVFGAGADRRRMVVRLAGGASVMDDRGVFNIGKRNYLAVRKILWKAGVMVHAEAVGGAQARTVRLEIGTGRFLLRTGGREEVLEKGTACVAQF